MAISALAAPKQPLKVYDVDIDVKEEARLVDIKIELNLKDFKIGRNQEAIFTPVVISDSGQDSIQLEPVTI